MRIGVVGGTGLYDWGPGEALEIETEHGALSATHHKRAKDDIFFLPRHGFDHATPAHRVDARATVQALAACRLDYAIAFFNVGALDPALPAGSWVVLDDLIDLSRARPRTFHDSRAVHVDLSRPFCPMGRKAILAAATTPVRDGGVYASTDGPRFETAAEARMLRTLGAHVAGMTAGPEAALAREAGLCYVGVAYVANAAGAPVAGARDVQRRMSRVAPRARAWVDRALKRFPARKTCDCAKSTVEAAITRRRTA